MASKKKVKKKVRKRVRNSPESVLKREKIQKKGLQLDGPTPDFTHLEIRKNVELPNARGSFYWDHLIAKLDAGDNWDMDRVKANSFAVRARNLGYVVVLSKIDKGGNLYSVWFGGLKK